MARAGFAERLFELIIEEFFDEHLIPIKNRLWELEERVTSAEDTLATFVAAFNDETNALAARLDDLMAQVANAGPAGVSSDQLNSALQPLSDRLKGLGSDGTTNLPTDDPTTTTDPTNSPTSQDPVVLPAPDAPTDEPTADPTVNPTGDLPTDTGAVSPDPGGVPSSGSGATVTTSTDDSATSTDTSQPSPAPDNSSTNTNDFREEL
jgi:hypothetical protein